MFIRIVTGIRNHFEDRFPEWIMGATNTYWGLKLVGKGDAWSSPEEWAGLLRLAPENVWGWLCIILGVMRLAALTINGTFADTAYSRYSPHVRGVTAILSTLIWLQVFLSVNAVSSSGSGIYQLPLIVDIWCVFHAWRDEGRGAKAQGNGLAQ